MTFLQVTGNTEVTVLALHPLHSLLFIILENNSQLLVIVIEDLAYNYFSLSFSH